MPEHPDPEVQKAIVRLADALCMWERATSRESVMIVREQGFEFRAVSGKPVLLDDVSDHQLMELIDK